MDVGIERIALDCFDINPSKVKITKPKLLELVIQKTDWETGFPIYLRALNNSNPIDLILYHHFFLYYSKNKEKTKRKYEEFKRILKSGNYRITLNFEEATAEILEE